jgi:hypothetical protein
MKDACNAGERNDVATTSRHGMIEVGKECTRSNEKDQYNETAERNESGMHPDEEGCKASNGS